MKNSPTSPHEAWLSRAVIALIMLVCALMMSQRMVDPDLWGHIQYGEDWLAEGALPRVASHTYAAPGYKWINHENLSELALAFGHRAVGGLGLMIGKAALGVLMLLSMIYVAKRRGAHPVLAASTMLVVSLGLIEFWCARPQLASFLCMALVLLVLDSAFRESEADEANAIRFSRLFWLIPILVVWTNAHGGFVAGVCIVAAFLGLKGLNALRLHKRTAMPTVLKLGGVIAACGLCTLINPYGPELLLWLLKSLGDPRPEISEWVSIPNSGPTIIPFTGLTLMTLVCLKFSTERKDPAQFITIGLVAMQTFLHCRHIVFFAILVGYWMPQHVQSVWNRMKAMAPEQPEADPLANKPGWSLAIPLAALTLLFSGLLAREFSQFGVERDLYPVDALQFMSDNDLNGRIVVTFNWAQYTLAAMPESTVGFDGRFRTCYPQSVVDMNFDLTIGDLPHHRHRAKDSGPFDPTRVLEHGNPDFVLIDRNRDGKAPEVMAQQSDWALLYQDKMSQLWGRRLKFADPSGSHFVAKTDITDREVTGVAAWPGFPRPTGRDAFVVSARTHLASQGVEQVTRVFDEFVLRRIARTLRSTALPPLCVQ